MTARPPPKFPLRLDQLAKATPTGAGDAKTPARTVLRPQQPVQHAHAATARAAPPASGLGLDSADVRARMAERLRVAGVNDPRVLQAMAAVPRHRFVDAALVTQAYEDTSLPIGHGQTISKPSVVARMLELLFGGANASAAGHLGRTLEIGTGCGYQAALLARLARQVYSIERLKPLHDKARLLLAEARPTNLRLIYGDGMLGHGPNAPYDAIIAAAGGEALPPAWLDQLAVGGRLVAPLRQPGTQRQVLVVVDRSETGCRHTLHEAVHFVPLRSGLAG
ncbi:MAG: protein-L-isoaspartate(D-aspartate) O-methyltransferase [Proteobacteria bacterium]|nr:protein-L-isoaspartate(D-aspartate) O-methyltransferase [Pseudomonadota bacterium]